MAENPDEPIFAPMPPFPGVDSQFSSSAGATPLTTVEDLEPALDSIFY